MTAELVKKWLISGNLAIWTVLELEKVLFYCVLVSRNINLRFCCKTQWQMFLLVSGHVAQCPSRWAPTWRLYTNLCKYGEKASPHKICCDLNLGGSLCIVTFVLFSDSGLNLLNGLIFILVCFKWHDNGNQQLVQNYQQIDRAFQKPIGVD